MIYDIIIYLILSAFIGVIWSFFSRSKRKKHEWYEVDSSTIAHTHRITKKKKK